MDLISNTFTKTVNHFLNKGRYKISQKNNYSSLLNSFPGGTNFLQTYILEIFLLVSWRLARTWSIAKLSLFCLIIKEPLWDKFSSVNQRKLDDSEISIEIISILIKLQIYSAFLRMKASEVLSSWKSYELDWWTRG